ncbi:hypothetical protein [Streptomyces griseosporeus]
MVGTQITGVPHLDTPLVHSLSFADAVRVRQRFGIPVEVLLGALNNAPHEGIVDPASKHRYQRAYARWGEAALSDQVDELYRLLFETRCPNGAPAARDDGPIQADITLSSGSVSDKSDAAPQAVTWGLCDQSLDGDHSHAEATAGTRVEYEVVGVRGVLADSVALHELGDKHRLPA